MGNILLGRSFLMAALILYNFMIFAFGDRIFDRKGLEAWVRVVVIFLNTTLAYLLATISSTMLCYLSAYLMLTLEFALFYRSNLKRIFCVVSASVMHLMALRAVTTAFFALWMKLPLYDTANQMLISLYSNGCTFLLSTGAILLVIKYVTSGNVQMVSNHVDQLNYLTVWMVVFNVYLLLNGSVYTSPNGNLLLTLNQILAPVIILTGLYVVIFFAIKNTTLLGYRDKNRALVVEIGEEKRKQLEWQYKAQRDSLTNLYNKGITRQLIDDYLTANPNSHNALFIADIDNFKNINDQFGHAFGDMVLCEISERLRLIVRGNDLVGRIGGDEFIIFIKNIQNPQFVVSRANEISRAFQGHFKNAEHATCTASGSVGAAISPTYGTTFASLYRNADIALYLSKSGGKNRATLYNGESFTGYEANRTEIDNSGLSLQKGFKGNRIEYVFHLLDGAINPATAIPSVLEIVSRHFEFSRGYVLEIHMDDGHIANTFEWCGEGIAPGIACLRQIAKADIGQVISRFELTGMNIVPDISALPQAEQDFWGQYAIKAMMQFAFFEGNKLTQIIGFDDCASPRAPTDAELNDISAICHLLSSFLGKMRAVEREQNTRQAVDRWAAHYHLNKKSLEKYMEGSEGR